MADPTINIRHGTLNDITGRPQRFEDITFIPANVVLDGSSFPFSHPLHEYTELIPTGMDSIVHPGNDAPWVLGRLMSLFHVTPSSPEFRPEKSCFHETFVAVLHSHDNLSIPFFCTDYYCKSSLIFSSHNPPEPSIEELIARQFWSLLFAEAMNVVDYESCMFHSGACIWVEFGVEDGAAFIRKAEDET